MVHPTHDTRISDASTFDEICDKCGATDTPGSTALSDPCPGEQRPGSSLPPTAGLLRRPSLEDAHKAVRTLLAHAGEDPHREGLKETPRRFVKMLLEMTRGGYDAKKNELAIETILGRTFTESSDEMVIVRDIDFVSMCEHHLLPFMGKIDVGYMPEGGKVIGLSKIPRLVDHIAASLQMQERLGRQIADALERHLKPRGVAVTIRSTHTCMTCRGVKKPGAEMVTSVCRGMFRDDARTRSEFLTLAQR